MPSVPPKSLDTTLRVGFLQKWKIQVVLIDHIPLIVRSTSTNTLLEVQEGLIFRTVISQVAWKMPPDMKVPIGFKRQRSRAKTGYITRQGAQEFLEDIVSHPIPQVHGLRGVGTHPYYLSSRILTSHGMKPNVMLASAAVLSKVAARNSDDFESDSESESN